MIKIAFCIRDDYKSRGGGDVVQMMKTKHYLELLSENIMIEILTDPKDLSKNKFDICHVFNFSTYEITSSFINRAKLEGIKVVASSIYWDYSVVIYAIFSKLRFTRLNSRILYFEKLIGKILNIFYPFLFLTSNKFKNYLLDFVNKCDIILPNSEEEMVLLCQFLGREKSEINYSVVVNACELSYKPDKSKIDAVNELLKQKGIGEGFVLQVGRIEPVKNQINLVEALINHADIPIVFIGSIMHQEYFDSLSRISTRRGNVYFISEVDHELIYEFYRLAAVHVLPSLRESPGLVSLEALSMGCKIAVSKFPYTPFETYFGSHITSFDPLDVNDMREKILKEYSKEKNNSLPKSEFTWEKTAEQTYSAYIEILNR